MPHREPGHTGHRGQDLRHQHRHVVLSSQGKRGEPDCIPSCQQAAGQLATTMALRQEFSSTVTSRTFYEFFAGGGLVRLGLGDGWECVGAIDIDRGKIAAYRTNFGDQGLRHDDVRNLQAGDIQGQLDLAWASFPCQDVSIAGNRSGLDGGTSGAFWPAWQVIQQLVDTDRAPVVIALENVRNLIGSNDGRDFSSVIGALASAGYSVGALLLDARLFLPHSRKRVFIVGVRIGVTLPPALIVAEPTPEFHPPDLRRAVERLPEAVRRHWVWWAMPMPEPSGVRLDDLVDESSSVTWHTEAETTALVASMGAADLEKLDRTKTEGIRCVGTIYVRSRPDLVDGRKRRANLRLDGHASCLVTPNGRMSSQIVVEIDGDRVRTRYMTHGEGARLMGMPSTYRMPRGYNACFRVLGEGVAVPVVRHLAHHLLEPLIDASQRPRMESTLVNTPARRPPKTKTAGWEASQTKVKDRPGIKGTTLGTTVYLLPGESKRLRRLALELDISLHELLLRGADRLLAENGQRPVERYRPTVKVDGS